MSADNIGNCVGGENKNQDACGRGHEVDESDGAKTYFWCQP